MAYRFHPEEFDQMLVELGSAYKLYGPTRYPNAGPLSETDLVAFGPVTKVADLELNVQSMFPPKELLLPVNQTLFYFTEDRILEPSRDQSPMIIFLRPCDVNGIKRLDAIFLENGAEPDPYYKQIRDRVRFFVLECTQGFEDCFCVSMQANTTSDDDVFLRIGSDEIRARVSNSEFGEIFEHFGKPAEFEPRFVQRNMKDVRVPEPEKLDNSIFESDLWSGYSSRCIACGRCNLSCPSCSCFTVRDLRFEDNPRQGERRRFWSGCHLDGFDEVSGGIVFRPSRGDRMRYKTLHKIHDFRKRFGVNMCVGCGRCEMVCPQYISFAECINACHDWAESVRNTSRAEQ